MKELTVNQDQWDWFGQAISRHAKAQLAPELVKLVMPWVRMLEYDEGDSIVIEDEIGRDMYLIYEGRVLVQRQGRKLAELEAGDFFGEISLLVKAPRTATVKAIGRCLVFELSWRAVSAIAECFPELMQAIWAAISRRMEELVEHGYLGEGGGHAGH